MKYWEIENINANTFVGNEIKRVPTVELLITTAIIIPMYAVITRIARKYL